jgi:hypothetical protein
MWLSNSKKYAMDRFWKIVHYVGSCITCGRTVRRHAKALTRYEIGQQADYNYRLERLLIEASVTPSLLCPIDGYQHSR